MEDDQQQFVHAQLPVHSQYDRDRLEYELVVRQEPKQARMCGVGADRRPIDPPPIVQLRVIDPSQRSQGGDSRPNSPGEWNSVQFCHAELFSSLHVYCMNAPGGLYQSATHPVRP